MHAWSPMAVCTDFVIHCRSSVNAIVRISSTPNEAYGIAEKYNIELQANECYELAAAPEPAAEQALVQPHQDVEYTCPTMPTITAEQ